MTVKKTGRPRVTPEIGTDAPVDIKLIAGALEKARQAIVSYSYFRGMPDENIYLLALVDATDTLNREVFSSVTRELSLVRSKRDKEEEA